MLLLLHKDKPESMHIIHLYWLTLWSVPRLADEAQAHLPETLLIIFAICTLGLNKQFGFPSLSWALYDFHKVNLLVLRFGFPGKFT